MNAEVHTLAGAYALNALPEDEREHFSRHLEQCAACRQEVDGLTLTAARLGEDVAETPPAWLRREIIERVSHLRQLPPLPRTESPHTERPRTESPATAETTDEQVTDDHTVVPMRRRRALPMLAAAAAFVLIALAGGVGIDAWLGDDQAQDPVAAVIAAEDAHTEQAELEGGGTLTLISSEEQDRAVVMAEALPELTSEQIYQLWFIEDSQVRSAETFFDGSGQGQAQVLEDLEPGVQVAITREPQGGSEEPSMDPLGVVALST